MRNLTQDAIRSLAGFKGDHAPVVSLYLDVDGRRHVRPKDYEMHLDQLLRQAKERSCRTVTGVEMFVRQAAAQFQLFTGERPPLDVMSKAVRDHLSPVSARAALPIKVPEPEPDDIEADINRPLFE